MMKLSALVSVFLTTSQMLCFAIVRQPGNQNAPATDRTGIYGLPLRLRDLTDLDYILYGKSLTLVQKIEILLNWLEQERISPRVTPSNGGIGAPIGSDYIQAQIVKTLGCCSDPIILDTLAFNSSISSNVRVSISLALGSRGDRRQIPEILSILQNNPNPYFRAIAVGDLYLLGAKDTISVIERATQDPYSISFVNMHHGPLTMYPVRDEAVQTLRNLQNAEIITRGRKYREEFDAKLAQAKKSSRLDAAAVERLAAAANGKPIPTLPALDVSSVKPKP